MTPAELRRSNDHFAFLSLPASENAANTTMSAATIVEPTGVPYMTEARIPSTEQSTEITAALAMTARKLLNTRIAERAGKMMSAEMSSAPTR